MAAHVLVVEDEKLLAKAIAATLRNAGFEVTVVHNGDEALDMVHRLRPDIILLDVMLPGKSGIDVCATLKTQPATVDIPVIMVSARSTPQDQMRGLIAGAEQYLAKPFSPTELLELIHHVLAGHSGRDWKAQKPILGTMPAEQLVVYAEELSQLYRQIRHDHTELEKLHRQLQETARLKDAFFKAVAQDLGALILPLQQAIQRLSAEPDTSRAALQRLSTAFTSYLKALVDLINLTARPAVPSPTRYNLLNLLPWLLQSHRLEAQERGIRLEARLPETLPAAIGDMELVKAALGYLLTNALLLLGDEGDLMVRAFTQKNEDTCFIIVQVTSAPVRVPPDVLLRLASGEVLPSSESAWALQLVGWSLRWSFLRYVSAQHGGWVRLFNPGESCNLLLALPAEGHGPEDRG